MSNKHRNGPHKASNDIIKDYGDWLLIDISTDKFKSASMAIDHDVFSNHKGGRIWAVKVGINKNIYAVYKTECKSKYIHRDAANTPKEMVTDHIHHYPHEFIDNRRSNLRAVTQNQNLMNRAMDSRNKSGVTGVCWHKAAKKWHAKIRTNGKVKNLGLFTNINDAAKARKEAEIKYFGEYAYKGEKND